MVGKKGLFETSPVSGPMTITLFGTGKPATGRILNGLYQAPVPTQWTAL